MAHLKKKLKCLAGTEGNFYLILFNVQYYHLLLTCLLWVGNGSVDSVKCLKVN